jgi:glycosyltransferase involved in cell wall biosynthesis
MAMVAPDVATTGTRDARASIESLLKVGYVSPGWPLEAFPNGIVTYVATVAPCLKQRGHSVSILAGHVVGTSAEAGVYNVDHATDQRSLARRALDGLYYRVAPNTASRRRTRRALVTTVRRAVREQNLQLVEMEESFGWAHWVRQSLPVPLCVRLHGPWFQSGQALGLPRDAAFLQRVRDEGRAIQNADAVSAPSHEVLRQVREYYGLSLPDAEVIPNPTPVIPEDQRWRLDACDPRLVLFVGRFDRLKGGDLIIQAFRDVLQQMPDARLLIVGPDDGFIDDQNRAWRLDDYVRSQIPGALESGTIRWLGQRPYSTLAELRRQAMVTVSCSRFETFCLTVLEAMALGCPQVAARVGGIPEVIEEEVHGLLHRPEDAADLARQILVLLRNPTRAASMGRLAAMDCERRFRPEVIVSQTEAFYRQTLARSAAKSASQFSITFE